jgi:hypothetical protein
MGGFWKGAVSTVLIALATANLVAGDAGKEPEIIVGPIRGSAEIRDALRAAVRLLPRMPTRIVVMDVTTARAGILEHLLTLDAFILRDNPAVCVVQQSELLQRARGGAVVYRAMLAAVLWHEMAHLAGADEPAARRAEEDLWTNMVRDEVIDQRTGLRYLQALKKRPGNDHLAAEIPQAEKR